MINSDRSAVDMGSAIAAAKEITFATNPLIYAFFRN
jgi:hypothetical protein